MNKDKAKKVLVAREYYVRRRWEGDCIDDVYYEIKSFLKVKDKAGV